MRAFPKALVVSLLAVSLTAQTPSRVIPGSRPTVIAMVVNGSGVTTLPALKTPDALMVAIVPLAHQVGIPVERMSTRLAFQVHGSWISIAPNDTTVREGNSPLMHLSAVPQKRDGVMYVTARDAGDLLDVDANIRPNRILVTNSGSKKQKNQDNAETFQVREIPVAKPTASATPQRVAGAGHHDEPGPDQRLIGHANLAVSDEGPNRTVNGMFDGGTQHVHGSVYVSRSGNTRPYVGGTIHADAGSHGVELGGVNDPLYGAVFAAGGTNGISLTGKNGTALSLTSSGFSQSGHRRVLAFTRNSGSITHAYALAGDGGSFEPLFGTHSWTQSAGRLLERDLWIGLRGIAAGVHMRTEGRLFTDSRFGFAGAGLPVGPGDVPEQATLGYEVSHNFELRGGFASGRGYSHAQGFAQASARFQSTELTLSRYGEQTGLGVVLNGPTARGNLDVFRSSSYSALSGEFQSEAARGILDARAYIGSGGSQDVGLAYHLKRDTPNFSFGIERIASDGESRVAPTVGYTTRVFHSLDLGIELHPLQHGNGVRFTAQQSLFAPIRSNNRFVLIGARDALTIPVYVMVDGVRCERLTSSATRIGLPAGTHYVSLQSDDGRFASPEERVTEIDSARITLPLWKAYEVRGSVRIADAKALYGVSLPLNNLTVVLQPGNIVAQTDENGRFSFPVQAIDPASTITVEPDSLPNGLAAPAPQKLREGDITLTLTANKKIEKVIF